MGNFKEDFFEGISLEEFFGRNFGVYLFGGGFLWEDFLGGFFGRIFGRIFWEKFFGRNLTRN